MSERTPQDVLRELRWNVHEVLTETKGDPEYLAGFEDACSTIVGIIDKAITETPDSPPKHWRDMTPAQWDAASKPAPDTLSEKPGLDAVRRAEDAVIGAARDLNVTMLDMGGGDPLRALDDALTALNDAERAALGSTDSEGR